MMPLVKTVVAASVFAGNVEGVQIQMLPGARNAARKAGQQALAPGVNNAARSGVPTAGQRQALNTGRGGPETDTGVVGGAAMPRGQYEGDLAKFPAGLAGLATMAQGLNQMSFNEDTQDPLEFAKMIETEDFDGHLQSLFAGLLHPERWTDDLHHDELNALQDPEIQEQMQETFTMAQEFLKNLDLPKMIEEVSSSEDFQKMAHEFSKSLASNKLGSFDFSKTVFDPDMLASVFDTADDGASAGPLIEEVFSSDDDKDSTKTN